MALRSVTSYHIVSHIKRGSCVLNESWVWLFKSALYKSFYYYRGVNGGFFCSCDVGYSGKTCGVNIDDCEPAPCMNGANCTDMVNDYSCDCTTG